MKKIRTRKKVTLSTAVRFVLVYTAVGAGLYLLFACAFHGEPFDSKTVANAIASGLGIMVARQAVWTIEYFTMGHIVE